MDRNRLVTIGLVVAMIGIAVLGWIAGVSPLLTQASAATEQAKTLQASNDVSEVRLAALKTQYENIGELKDNLTVLRKSVPSTIKMPVFLRQINGFTAQAGVGLTSVSVSEAITYPDLVAQSPDSEAPAGGDDLVVIPVKVTVGGQYANVMSFVGLIQEGPRLFMINSLAVSYDESNGIYTGVLDGWVYALPTAGDSLTDEELAEVGTTPTPTPTPEPTETAEPSPEPTETATEG